MRNNALLALTDGMVFAGISIGADGFAVGEVVFNTAMSGYQEILTDPSYAMQIITMTSVHIGNVGVNVHDEESSHIHANGLVVRDMPAVWNNWRGEQSLSDYLKKHHKIAIAGIDTRQLTNKLRNEGSQAGCIMANAAGDLPDPDTAIAKARAFPGMVNLDVVKLVSTPECYRFSDGSDKQGEAGTSPAKFRVVAYDFGIKHNILRMLHNRDCEVIVVPATTTAEQTLALEPDGLFLSNGPGDPRACEYAIKEIRQLLHSRVPLFGICFGCQLLALACGARIVKMKLGHHGANHPVQELTKHPRVFVTSQNHGFAVDEQSLPPTLCATHRSLFDQSLQGIRHTEYAAFGFQGHPEASPGPHDLATLFDHFIDNIKKNSPHEQRLGAKRQIGKTEVSYRSTSKNLSGI